MGGNGPVFVASLIVGQGGVTEKNAAGVWAMASDGALQLLFRTGDKFQTDETSAEKTVKKFNVLKAVTGSMGVTRGFNDGGLVIWRATFTDGTQGIIETTIP